MMQKIVLAITGSIAAGKGLQLYYLLKKNYHVELIITPGASHFLHDLPPEALNNIFEQPFYDKYDDIAHIEVVRNADLFVCYPASLNFIASCAYGLTPQVASLCYAAAACPKIHFPAMNSTMYQSKAALEAIAILKKNGDRVVEPATGELACNTVGQGRALEPGAVLSIINEFFSQPSSFLKGKKALINFGRTRAYIDRVRYITNESSGKMGLALYNELLRVGAEVTSIVGDTDLPCPSSHHVASNQEMLKLMMHYFTDAEVVIACAALTDFEVSTPSTDKITKEKNSLLTLQLRESIDVLEELGKHKKAQFLVGFSLQNNFNLEDATNKLVKKSLDAIIVNEISAMSSSDNSIIFMTKDGETHSFSGSKVEAAHFIIASISVAMSCNG